MLIYWWLFKCQTSNHWICLTCLQAVAISHVKIRGKCIAYSVIPTSRMQGCLMIEHNYMLIFSKSQCSAAFTWNIGDYKPPKVKMWNHSPSSAAEFTTNCYVTHQLLHLGWNQQWKVNYFDVAVPGIVWPEPEYLPRCD